MVEVDSSPSLEPVFAVLKNAAAEAYGRGTLLFGAQAKKHVVAAFPDFDERDYKLKKFTDVLRAGDEANSFRLEMIAGHPTIAPVDAPAGEVARHAPSGSGRLKPDLWASMVSWGHGVRYWDRKRARAYFVPTDDSGTPAWESSPADFVAIEPIPMGTHMSWMRQFASQQPEPGRATLLEALDAETPGAFKRQLGQQHLQSDWMAYLEAHVRDHARAWAERNGLAPTSISESRSRTTPSRPVTPVSAPQPRAATPVPLQETDDHSTALRTRLHQIIDQMSLAELASLPVPAGYLLPQQ